MLDERRLGRQATVDGARAARRERAAGREAPGSGGSPASPEGANRAAGSPILGKDADSAAEYGCSGSVKTWSAGPRSTTRPAYITAIRSLTSASTDRSWLIISIPTPSSLTSPESTSSTWACTITSSAVVGSSAMISEGRQASAIAIITRCRCPPESWWG